MTFAIGAPVPWPLPPDWGSPVRESLAWFNDVGRSRRAFQSKRRLRIAPRRSFAFEVQCGPDPEERRLADALRHDHGAREWLLPVFPDVQIISAVAAASDTVACRTEGFDFSDGGQALLWRAPRQWEIVPVASVSPGGLSLDGTTAATWGNGTRLYPLRAARLARPVDERAQTDRIARLRLEFDVDEACDWPGVLPAATYRGKPVLEWRGDEREDPLSSYVRTIDTVDVQTGPPAWFDPAGASFRGQEQRWLLHGRTEQAAFRSLLYGLAGRYAELWVPTFLSDLQLVASAASGSSEISVAWCGYTVFGRQQFNRRDLRIELFGGQVLYRRITDSAEDGDSETLTLDAPLGVDLAPSQVRQISFLFYAQLANDTVELEHLTDADGTARSVTRWEAIRDAD